MLQRADMPKPFPQFFFLLLLAAAMLYTGCRSGKPVEIAVPVQGAQFEGGREIEFRAALHGFQGTRIRAVWHFGDGATAAGLCVRHAFDRAGMYAVTVTVTSEFNATAADNTTIEITSSRFSKLDRNAAPLPDSAQSWVLVRDEITGLVWEVKENRDYIPDYGNPHDADNTYTWYDDNPLTNGGNSGNAGQDNDTSDFIWLINAEEFGGYADWRMPDCDELALLRDALRFNPAINTDYFPHTAAWYYWSGTTYAQFPGSACHIDFMGNKPAAVMKNIVGILNHYGYKSIGYHARAVRGGN
jgi:hypothetical protein